MKLESIRHRYLAAMGVPTLLATAACPTRRAAEVDAGATETIAITGIPTGAVGAGRLLPGTEAGPVVVPEPIAPWPASTHPYGCVPESGDAVPAPLLPAPFTRCVDTLRESTTSVTRLSPQATLDRRRSDATACCYVTFTQVAFQRGRPLHGETGPVVATAHARDDWRTAIAALDTTHLSPDERRARADHWLAQAAAEHASVASFSRFSLQLTAVGAPPDLLAGAHRAALDEIEHAQMSYALASAYAGETRGPGALDLKSVRFATPTLAELAVETFLDGCVGETLAAVDAHEDAAIEPEPTVRGVLRAIAQDEERHAELAWRTVAWALRAGGPPIARALGSALDELRAGTHAHDARAATTLREVVIPCAEALLA